MCHRCERRAAVESLGLPLFTAFEDVPDLCERLVTADLPGMDIQSALEFLLCFGSVSAAEAVLRRFFVARANLLPQYRSDLEWFRSNGLPAVVHTGYAPQLAFATIAYNLQPPGSA